MQKFLPLVAKSSLVVLGWWLLLQLLANYSVKHFGVHPTFPYYNSILQHVRPAQAVWAHFDGAHYLKLAQYGYVDQGTQAFFPVYPLLIRAFATLGIGYVTVGQVISLLSLTLTLTLLYLWHGRTAFLTIASLLLFPTSFFLGALYTESFFLLLTISFFLALSRQSFGWAFLLAAVASGTRLAGSLLVISLALALWHSSRRYLLLLLPLALSGLFVYMSFLHSRFGDPLAFVHVQAMFGAGRSGGEVVLLPQVLYRYAKIILTVTPTTLAYWLSVLELATFIGFFFWVIRRLRSLTVPTSTYIITSLLLPTLSGTLSSLPRYALVILPFLLVPTTKLTLTKVLILIVSTLLLVYLFSLFAQGLFVA